MTLDSREAIQERLTGLREERGRRVAAGQAFDSSLISEAEQQLDTLDDVQAEHSRQQSQAATDAERERRIRVRARLAAAEAARRVAVDEAQNAADALANALKAIDLATAEATTALSALGYASAVVMLDKRDTISAGIINILRHAIGGSWGRLSAPDPGSVLLSRSPGRSWSETLALDLGAFAK